MRHRKMSRNLFLFIILLPALTSAQLKVDANIDLTGTIRRPESTINTNFRGDDPFNPFRAKVFIGYQFNSTLGIETEILFDSKAHAFESPTKKAPVRPDGYFLSIRKPFETLVNFWIGKIPTPVQSFTARSYSHLNPLIGYPLMHHYKVPLSGFDVVTNTQILSFRDNFSGGVTSIYEACWVTGVSAFGKLDVFDWMVAVAKGTLTNPEARKNDGYQIAGRIGAEPLPWLKIGLSGGIAPYLENGTSVPSGTSREDVHHRLLGTDASISWKDLTFHSELVFNSWDTPLLAEKSVHAVSWYVEAKYDIIKELYAAARVDQMLFNEIKDASGTLTPWGYDVHRQEIGIGAKLIKELTIKAVIQHNTIDNPSKREITYYALQSVLRFEDLQELVFGKGEKKPSYP